MRRLAFVVGLFGGCATQAVDPCVGFTGTCLSLQVDPSTGITQVDDLLVQVAGYPDQHPANVPTALQLPVAVGLAFDNVATDTSIDLTVTGFLSGSTIGAAHLQPLILGGRHETLHVQLAPVGGAMGDLSHGSATDLSTLTPCKMYSSYDHYCIDQGYPPHFNQCDGNETPASGCENVLLTGVSCGQGGGGGTIRDCFCCP